LIDIGLEGATSPRNSTFDEARAWLLLRALAARARTGPAVNKRCGGRVDGSGQLEVVDLGHGWLDVHPDASPAFRATGRLPRSTEQLLDLYLPLCVGGRSAGMVVGHIGQSLDGQIATSTGASCFITGPQDLAHTHRLRALFDAVVVGRSTIANDDPRLTTRLVPGVNPTRVVLDPGLRAPADRKVFRDGDAPTLVLCARGARGRAVQLGQAEIVEVPTAGDVLSPSGILAELGKRSLRRVFIEGGGVTISHFLRAGLVDRMHVAVSPVFLGQGRPGLALAKIDGLDQALRPRVRRFVLGEDVLFDCAFGVSP
jgi:diaminohydroxyphosphoribosylaminopyrimidine deaminase / 5-amino-6-(5-phosphoribosylamino)uracil reductase